MPVYFIVERLQNSNLRHEIKIGRSINVERRVKQLQTGNPNELALMGWIEGKPDAKVETELHRRHKASRVRGEWFELAPTTVLDELKAHCYDAFIAVSDCVFNIETHDKDGVPELYGPWEWGETELEDFCPRCGYALGAPYDERFNAPFCLSCGVIHELT